MRYNRRRPCDSCPFRNDTGYPWWSGYARAKEIVTDLEERGGFPCHKTYDMETDEEGDSQHVYNKNTQACAGALILGRHSKFMGLIDRIAIIAGIYDPSKLIMDSPVWTDANAYLEYHKQEK